MIKAHQIQLNLTKTQKVFMVKSCGVARFSYNYALAKWKQGYEKGEKPNAYSLIKHLNSIKKVEFPWMRETGKCASQYAIHNVESAYKKMWKEKSGYPKFKKKGNNDSFVAVESQTSFKQKNFKLKVPRLGWVKCHENLRFQGKVNNVVIKRIADKWFAVVNVDTLIDFPVVCENQTAIGIDMGIKTMMVLSNGTVYENPKALKSNLKSLKRLQRGLTRKVKGSNNRKKQQMKVANKHYKISNIRKNAIHQATTDIVKKHNKIVIETLKPLNMVKNHKLAQAVSDVSFGEIKRQLEYKCKWYGKELIKADMWFASSKTCSSCNNKKDKLSLSERTYKCENCGLVLDRDLNAAINLANYSPTPKVGESKACGERLVETQRSSVKHEILNKLITI